LVQQWRQSRLSVREFCDWQELSEASFYAWRRELAKRDREASGLLVAVTSESRAVERNSSVAATPPMFLPVQVVPEMPAVATEDSPRANCIEVHLPSGVCVHVPAGCPRQALTEVLAALEAQPC